MTRQELIQEMMSLRQLTSYEADAIISLLEKREMFLFVLES
ncbi:hypothetical protein VYI21_002970 [Streptococcus anginosus]